MASACEARRRPDGHAAASPPRPRCPLDRPVGEAIRPLVAGLYKPRRRPPSLPTLTLIHFLPPAAARLASLLVSDLSPSRLSASPLVFLNSGERPGPGAGTSRRHGLGDPSSRSRTDHVASSSPCRPPRHLRRHRRRRTLVLRIRI